MLYNFRILGKSFGAEYVFNTDSNQMRMTAHSADKPGAKKEISGCYSVVVKNSKNLDQIRERWIVMHGTPTEIVQTIETKWSVAKLEADMIFDYLDTVEANEVVTFMYLLDEPSPVVKQSHIYKATRLCQSHMLGKLIGVDAKDIRFLDRAKNS